MTEKWKKLILVLAFISIGGNKMQKLVNKVANYCVNKELIRAEDIPWFVYGLESRIPTFSACLPVRFMIPEPMRIFSSAR